MKIIFAGTPDFAAKHLQALLDSEHQVIAVYSQPDRPAGRGKKLQASAVKQLAESQQIPVYQPKTLKDTAAQAELAALGADVMVVVAYGLILPQAVLQTPPLGCLNVHGSLLPKWRGAAPIQRSIWAGDHTSGVTIMQMDQGLDTGPILLTRELPIAADETSATLYDKLAKLGPQALVQALEQLPQLQGQAQEDKQASYAQKLSKQEARIDWQLSGEQLERNVRAFNPWPISWFELDAGPVKVWHSRYQAMDCSQHPPGTIIAADKQSIAVATGNGVLHLLELQLAGKKAMPVADILNSRGDWFTAGTQLP